MKIKLPKEILEDLKTIEEGYKKMADINLEFANVGVECENEASFKYEELLKRLRYYGS